MSSPKARAQCSEHGEKQPQVDKRCSCVHLIGYMMINDRTSMAHTRSIPWPLFITHPPLSWAIPGWTLGSQDGLAFCLESTNTKWEFLKSESHIQMTLLASNLELETPSRSCCEIFYNSIRISKSRWKEWNQQEGPATWSWESEMEMLVTLEDSKSAIACAMLSTIPNHCPSMTLGTQQFKIQFTGVWTGFVPTSMFDYMKCWLNTMATLVLKILSDIFCQDSIAVIFRLWSTT